MNIAVGDRIFDAHADRARYAIRNKTCIGIGAHDRIHDGYVASVISPDTALTLVDTSVGNRYGSQCGRTRNDPDAPATTVVTEKFANGEIAICRGCRCKIDALAGNSGHSDIVEDDSRRAQDIDAVDARARTVDDNIANDNMCRRVIDDDASACPPAPSIVMLLVIVTAPKPPGSSTLMAPLVAVLEIAPAKVLQGAVRLQGFASSPTPDTHVRVA